MSEKFVPGERLTAKSEPTRFSLRGVPLLSEGSTMERLGVAENLWLHVKVYASGGENALHAHTVEDHAFFVLQGAAVFTLADETEIVVAQHDGMLVPKGNLYSFRAVEGENLVMLRVGGAQLSGEPGALGREGLPASVLARTAATGEDLPADSHANGTGAQQGVRLPGKFFGAPL